MLAVLPTATAAAQEQATEVAPTFHRKSTWRQNHYDPSHRFACSTSPAEKQARAVWNWPETPAGHYRIEAFIPPYEATATVSYRIQSDADGLVTDPVRLIQAAKRGAWARVADFSYAGGHLWMELGTHGTESSGTFDWCAWGGDHSIGAANARLVPIDESDIGAPPPVAEESTGIRLEGNNYERTLTPVYRELYSQYVAQSPNGGMCESRSTRGRPSTDKPWLVTNDFYAFYLGECTSWVQFRLRGTVAPAFDNAYGRGTHGGGLWGHAGNWGDNAARLGALGVAVSQAPEEHSVALWQPRKSGSRTTLGHVAFVEAVSDDGNVIWISEMNWSDAILCHLNVRRIIKGTSAWPDAFIHFDEASRPDLPAGFPFNKPRHD